MSGEAARLFSEDGAMSSSLTVGNITAGPELQELIARAREGRLPLSRPLKSYEPAKLNDVHLNMIYMRAAGLQETRIAEILDYQVETVCIIMNHPFGKLLLNRLQAEAARQATDINARLQQLAPKAVNAIEDILDDRTTPHKVRKDTAFDLLTATGYGQPKTERHIHEFAMPARQAELLGTALRETREIREISYVEVASSDPGSGAGTASADLAPADDGRPPLDGSQVSTETEEDD